MYPYRIDDLRLAIDELKEQVEGLDVSLDPTGQTEGTAQGPMPTVHYTLNMAGHEVSSKHPLAVVALPRTLAQELRTVLGSRMTPEVERLVRRIETYSVT